MLLKNLAFACGLASAILWSAVKAEAATLSCVNCTNYDLTSKGFDPSGSGISSTATIQIATATNQGLYLTGPANLTFQYVGKEASYTNQWGFGVSSNILLTTSSLVGASSSTSANTGYIDYFFTTTTASDFGAVIVRNGSVPSSTNYARTLGYYFINSSPTSAVWMLLFNDGGGDKDYDDMFIKMTATWASELTPVPVPGALPLLGSALGVFGVMGWRRRRQAAPRAA